MQRQVQKRRLFDKLPQYGKELLRALDSTHQLDRLQCNICSDYFNFDNKKPVIICVSKTCSYQHGICEQCFNDIIKSRKSKEQQAPLKCSFCKQICHEKFIYDQSRFELIKKLSTVTETLSEISANAKLVTQKETQKKLKQIVERAQKDIFNTNLESKRKSFLLNRLKTRIKNAYSQNQRIIKEVEQRQQDLVKRQNQFKIIMEDIMNNQKQLQGQNSRNLQLIKQFRKQNEELKKKLSQYEDIQSLQSRTIPKHQRAEKRQKMLYHSDYYFHQFKFVPRRDESFVQNFKENRECHLIELKRERQKYFNTIGEKKIVYHSELFNIENQQQKLICFQVNSHNKRVNQYKFGLADQQFRQIKNASVSISTLQVEDNQPLIITFYVNLIKMKLYATTNNVRRSQDLPKKLVLTKFTVFLYFFDINTQLTFEK